MKRLRLLWVFFWFTSAAAAATVPGYYIVELTADPAARLAARIVVARNGRAIALQQRDTVRAGQRAFRQSARVADSEVVTSVDLVANALVLHVSDQRAATLARDPQVAHVYPVHEMKANMDQVLPLIHAPQAWALIGGIDQAGAGIKIGVIDSGIDQTHPAFQDPNLTVPDGFPLVDTNAGLAYTTNKVIVQRSYLGLLNPPSGTPYQDALGHGTAVAAIAAGVQNLSRVGKISGVAPKAWLGSYQVTNTSNQTSDAAVLKALDDAVADGMDVLNFSVGFDSSLFDTPDQISLLSSAVDRAFQMGVIVVWSAGNQGPQRNTLLTAALSDSSLVVGGTLNSRLLAGTLSLDDDSSYAAVPSSNILQLVEAGGARRPVSATLRNATDFDPTGQVCSPLPPASLSGMIVLISATSNCLFETQSNVAQAAGAIGAVVYSEARTPEALYLIAATATLPSVSVSYADGQALIAAVQADPFVVATLTFAFNPQPVDSNQLWSHASRGPAPTFDIRPDLVAVADYIYSGVRVAGSDVASGTSFAAPQVAGAAAVLKAARPGLAIPQYYSLLTNTATPMLTDGVHPANVMESGAGRLNVEAGVSSTLAAYPRSISFGVSSGSTDLSRDLTITNLGSADDKLQLTIESFDGQAIPIVPGDPIPVPAGQSATASVHFSAPGLAPREYQGYVHAQSLTSGAEIRIPYWYGVPSDTPAFLSVFSNDGFQAGAIYGPGFTAQTPIMFRLLDAIGIPIRNPSLVSVSAVSGGGTILSFGITSNDPSQFGVAIRFGPNAGRNVFRIQSGVLSQDVVITTVAPDSPNIQASQYLVDLGGALTGSSITASITLTNAGAQPLAISSITSSNPRFQATSPTGAVTLPQGATQAVTVRFSPNGTGSQSAILSIASNDPLIPSLDILLQGTGVAPGGPLALETGGAFFNRSFGYPTGAATAYFLNRLTPPKYPASLQDIEIFFGARLDGLPLNTPITILAGTNPGGTTNIDNVGFQQLSGSISSRGSFNVFRLSSSLSSQLTIYSGDFVVGFLVNNPPNMLPGDLDSISPSQRRSYASFNGVQFTVVDDAGVPGSFGIRASVSFPSGTAGAAQIQPDTTIVNFGPVLSGFTKDVTFNLSNPSAQPLEVSSIDSSNPGFTIVSPSDGFTVQPGGKQGVTVRFTPASASSPPNGTLAIASNDPLLATLNVTFTGSVIPPSGPLPLAIDGGAFNTDVGFPGSAAAFVNRLTPPTYPATLQDVRIYFGFRSDDLPVNTPITIIVGTNPSGSQSLIGVTFQQISGTITKLNDFNTFTIPDGPTLNSGDFVVGFLLNDPNNIFPADIDVVSPRSRRSYLSNTGGDDFALLDDAIPSFAGNFGIRATIVFPNP